jgi:hypothetical protein
MSHGSDDSDNYWPGYVDALTSMVQVLAFVMMMLAMAVFVLSQSVSKKAIEAIAAAVNADVKPNSDVTQLTQAVMQKIDSLRGSTSADPVPVPAAPKATEVHPAEEQRIAGMRINAPRTQPRTAPIEPKPDAPRLTVEFDGGSYRIDEPRARSVGKFVDENAVIDKSKPIVVNAYAYTGEGAISEARRLAYYRAMMARKQLIDAKVRPENIRINVNDIADRAKAQTVEMILAETSAN